VEGGIYTAVSGRWDIYSGEWKVGIYTAVSGRWDIYSGEWKVGHIQR
jgi:hypothetical protein